MDIYPRVSTLYTLVAIEQQSWIFYRIHGVVKRDLFARARLIKRARTSNQPSTPYKKAQPDLAQESLWIDPWMHLHEQFCCIRTLPAQELSPSAGMIGEILSDVVNSSLEYDPAVLWRVVQREFLERNAARRLGGKRELRPVEAAGACPRQPHPSSRNLERREIR